MGETLKRKLGPLPVWVWAILFVILIAAYLMYRQRKTAAAQAAAAQTQANNLSSDLGTVPVSNLTTAAQPMPIQMGDTFVNTSVPTTVNASPTTTINNQPPSYTLQTAPPPAPTPPPVKPAPAPSAPAKVTTLPGYGSGLGALLGLNPNLLKANIPPSQGGVNIPGITGYKVSYNGVPL